MIGAIVLAAFVGAPPVDRQAEALLRQVEAKASRLKGFACDLTAERTYPSARPNTAPYHGVERLHVEFSRPNRFAIDSGEGKSRYRSLSDGTNVFSIGQDSYSKDKIDAKARDFHWYHDDLLLLMVTGSFAQAVEAPRSPVLRLLPNATWKGKSYRVLEAKVGGGYPITYRLFVGPDLLVYRIIHEEANSGRTLTIDSSATNIVPNPPQKSGAFAFVPSAGQKERSSVFPLQPGEYPLVKPGAVATDFTLPTPSGGKLSLRDAMKESKAVLLNFWFVHCPPCRAEHPHLQKFYEKMKPKGLAVIAIDDQDTAAESAKYLKGAGLTFPVVLTGPRFRTDPKTGQPDYQGAMMPDYASLAPYGIRSCPTNVLIDSQTGKVVYLSQAWDEKALEEALAKLGVR
ncbi:TlpA family protein disulfide reductase [bacterium]|nr:MAG: TlpA family protein disulfide reductase [bacterium]